MFFKTNMQDKKMPKWDRKLEQQIKTLYKEVKIAS